MTQLSNVEIISRCPLFAMLAEDDLLALAGAASVRHLHKGEMLFYAGDDPAGIFILKSGCMRIFLVDEEAGRELTLHLQHPFQSIAEIPAIDTAPYPANAQAETASCCLWIPQDVFEQMLFARSSIAVHCLRMLATKQRQLVGLVQQLTFSGVSQRLAHLLLEGTKNSSEPFALPTNAALAATIGTVPELISRNLSRFQQEGVIAMQERRIVVLDREKLEALSC